MRVTGESTSAEPGHQPRIARARDTPPQPRPSLRRDAQVEPPERSPREHRSDVQIGDREAVGAEVVAGELAFTLSGVLKRSAASSAFFASRSFSGRKIMLLWITTD